MSKLQSLVAKCLILKCEKYSLAKFANFVYFVLRAKIATTFRFKLDQSPFGAKTEKEKARFRSHQESLPGLSKTVMVPREQWESWSKPKPANCEDWAMGTFCSKSTSACKC